MHITPESCGFGLLQTHGALHDVLPWRPKQSMHLLVLGQLQSQLRDHADCAGVTKDPSTCQLK